MILQVQTIMYRILPMKVMMRSTVAAGNLFVQE